MADGCPIDVVPGDLAQHLFIRKRHLAAHMRQPAMGWDEGQPLAISAQNPQHADVDPVFEILLAQVFRDRSFLANRADIELLAGAERQLAFRGKGCDAAQHRLIGRFQLHQEKLAVHGDVLEIIAIRQNQVGVELHASLLEAPEDADHLFLGKELDLRHGFFLIRIGVVLDRHPVAETRPKPLPRHRDSIAHLRR